MQNNPTKIILHHSGDASLADQFQKINEYHKSLNFPISSLGFYIGYTYLINHGGELTACRAIPDEQAHTKGLNFNSIGICLEGNFEEGKPTGAQVETLAKLLLKLCEDFKFDVTNFYLHRDFRQTACPGKNIDKNWMRYLYLDYKTTEIKEQISCDAQ